MTQEIAALAAEHGRVAVDTEFMSERRYRALLCLVQVAVPDPGADDGVRTDVLDPLEGGFDPAPLAKALADPAIEVVMHAGRQDVALLRREWNTEIRCLFDTQVAAGFLGLGPQEGYESLVRRVLNIKLKGGRGFRSAWRSAAGWSGRSRSAARWRARATSATPSGCSSACPSWGASTRRAAAWPGSWSTGASRPLSRPTAPPPRSCPTRR